ncbi:hypothetical protein [Clostridium sardiniense]|uniref:hypothetical protein n=1 Tax=Clostridium sardiniense TaxID=29369 RepID=UPI001956CC9E|nr:hypothetical protein [Clostridium sardiniense]MBM7835739.1 hypothetical protein [Clostridium sardiniense]
MNTTYDEIWETFIRVCGYNYEEIPTNENVMKNMINNASVRYNKLANKYSTFTGNLKLDDISEEANFKLNENEITILANIIAYNFAKFKFTEFTSLYNVVANDLGMKDYKAQCSGRLKTINDFKNEYMALIQDEDLGYEV